MANKSKFSFFPTSKTSQHIKLQTYGVTISMWSWLRFAVHIIVIHNFFTICIPIDTEKMVFFLMKKKISRNVKNNILYAMSFGYCQLFINLTVQAISWGTRNLISVLLWLKSSAHWSPRSMLTPCCSVAAPTSSGILFCLSLLTPSWTLAFWWT